MLAATQPASTATTPPGRTVAAIWPQLQITSVNYRIVFSQLAILVPGIYK